MSRDYYVYQYDLVIDFDFDAKKFVNMLTDDGLILMMKNFNEYINDPQYDRNKFIEILDILDNQYYEMVTKKEVEYCGLNKDQYEAVKLNEYLSGSTVGCYFLALTRSTNCLIDICNFNKNDVMFYDRNLAVHIDIIRAKRSDWENDKLDIKLAKYLKNYDELHPKVIKILDKLSKLFKNKIKYSIDADYYVC